MTSLALLAAGASGGASSSPSMRVVFASQLDSWQLFTIGIDGGAPRQLTGGLDNKTEPAWSPDGRAIAYVGDRGGKPHIYLVGTDGTGERRLTGSGEAESGPTWSPDSRFVAFARAGSVYVAAVDGSGERRLTSGPEDRLPSWSPRGDRIAFARGCELLVVAAAGGDPTPVRTEPTCVGARLSWSPDATRLVTHLFYPPYGSRADGLYVVDVATGTSRLVPGQERLVYADPAWAPDGRTIALSACCAAKPPIIALIDQDGSHGRPLTVARRHFYGDDVDVGDKSPSWAPGGRQLVFSRNTAGTSQVYSILPDGTGLRRISHGPYTEALPAADPTGRSVAFFRYADHLYGATLLGPFVMDGQGRHVRQLKRPRGLKPFGTVDWSPDGSRLAIGSLSGLWTWSRATGGFRHLTRSSAIEPSWSPEGRRISFTQPASEPPQYEDGTIASIGADGRLFRVLSRSGCAEGEADWAPDGRQLVFERTGALYVMAIDGRRERLLVPGGYLVDPYPDRCQLPADTPGEDVFAGPEWSPDGSMVAAGSDLDDPSLESPSVYLVRADGAGFRRLVGGAWPTWVAGG